MVNYLDSNGFYFAGGLNIKPGQNMPISQITPQQAKLILKSDLVNKIPEEDLEEIKDIANTKIIVNSFAPPTRANQVITSKLINGKLQIVWEDLYKIPMESSDVSSSPVQPIPEEKDFWRSPDWKTINCQFNGDKLAYTGGTYLAGSPPTDKKIFVIEHSFMPGDEFAIQIPLTLLDEFMVSADCSLNDSSKVPLQYHTFSDASSNVFLDTADKNIKTFGGRHFLDARDYKGSIINVYAKRLDDFSFTMGYVDETGKLLRQFNSYGYNSDSCKLRLSCVVKNDVGQVELQKGLVAVTSNPKEAFIAPVDVAPQTPAVPTEPSLPSISNMYAINFDSNGLTNVTYSDKKLSSNGGYLSGITSDSGGQAKASSIPRKLLIKLGANNTILYWGNGESFFDYLFNATEYVKVEFGLLENKATYVEITVMQNGNQSYFRYKDYNGQLSWKEGDLIEISVDSSGLKYKNLTAKEVAQDTGSLTFIDKSSTTFITAIQGVGSVEIGTPEA